MSDGQPADKKISIHRLGLRSFLEVWELQKKAQQDLIRKSGPEQLIICSHNPVITLGTGAKVENILADERQLALRNTEVIRIERGGDVTYHGPEQAILYPIINLNFHKRDVDWYMRRLEEVIIECLNDFGILGARVKGRTGVWIENRQNSEKPKKIASIGIRISRWCTMHGLALNIKDCSNGFALINPCGYHDVEMTSAEQETGRVLDTELVADNLVVKFSEVFGYNGL